MVHREGLSRRSMHLWGRAESRRTLGSSAGGDEADEEGPEKRWGRKSTAVEAAPSATGGGSGRRIVTRAARLRYHPENHL